MRKTTNPRWPSCPRDPSRRLHPLLPATLPVPEQRLAEKTVEPDRGVDWVKSNQNLEESVEEEIVNTAHESSGKIEKKEEITTNDLEESVAEEIVKTAQESSGIIEKKEEITTNDLDESVVEEIVDARESSDEEEENGASSEEELVADPDSDSETDSGTGIMPPQLKFLSPTVFKATPEDDAFEWLERYEATGAYNQWGDTELRANFNMYLDGTARKWYLCATLPSKWRDVPFQAGAGPNGADIQAETGLRTVFLKEFQQQNYKLFQETRLRNRIQGIEESTTNYYYDVIDLCRVVDPTMAEATKVDYLFGGLRPSLVQKFYPLQPKTSEEFLEVVKRFTDAKLLANRRNWPDAVLGMAATGQADIPVEFIRTYPKPTPSAADTELWKVIKELQGAVENLTLQATPPPKRPGYDLFELPNSMAERSYESTRTYRHGDPRRPLPPGSGTGGGGVTQHFF